MIIIRDYPITKARIKKLRKTSLIAAEPLFVTSVIYRWITIAELLGLVKVKYGIFICFLLNFIEFFTYIEWFS